MSFDYNFLPGESLNKRYESKNNEKPIISIITAFYNGKDYLYKTANSVLNQTFPYFEWIIVNDGSADKKSLTILESVSKLDKRIKVFNKKNEGLSCARDFGTRHSSKDTKYIMFLDDDDLIDTIYLETAYWALETSKDASWVYTDVANFGMQDSLWAKKFDSKVEKKVNLLTATALIRKEAFISVKGYALKEKAVHEDWNLWLKLIAKGYYPVKISRFGFYYRRKNANSELLAAQKNHKEAIKIISETVKTIKKDVKAIEYPKFDATWHGLRETFNYLEPKYIKNDKKDILFIIPWMTVGGADRFNLDLIKGLSNKYNFTIITTLPNINEWGHEFTKYATVYDLTSFLNQDYWHTFIEYIVKNRKIDLIMVSNSTYGYSLIPYLKAKFSDIPIIDYIHMEEWYNRDGGFSRDSANVHDFIDKTLFCNNNSEKIMNNYFNIASKETGTVYIGVDQDKYNPDKFDVNDLKNRYKIPEDKKVVTFISRIDYQKRPMLFMNVVKQYLKKNKNVVFLVVGAGPLLSKMKRFAKNNKLNRNIIFVGNQDKDKVNEIYAISDATINCSIKEGLALTTYESLIMDVPVISSNVGGQGEIINDKVGCVIDCLQNENEIRNLNYDEKEVNQYVVALTKVLGNLPKYKGKCRERVLNGFTLNLMIEKMNKYFMDVINNPNSTKINNGKNLNKMINLAKDREIYYFQAFKSEYIWASNEYNHKIEYFCGENCEVSYNPSAFRKKAKKIAKKYNIYKPIAKFMNFGRDTIWRIKNWR